MMNDTLYSSLYNPDVLSCLANLSNDEVFTPPAKEIDRARRILQAMEQAKREGKGAVSLDGRLIDIASIRQAAALVATADRIAQAGGCPHASAARGCRSTPE